MLSNNDAILIHSVAVALAATSVALRLYVQCYLRKVFTASDAFILLGFAIFIQIFITDVIVEKTGMWDISPAEADATEKLKILLGGDKQVQTVMKINYVNGPASFCTMWCIKAAFLLFYFALFPKSQRYLRAWLYVTALVTVVAFITSECLMLFSCRPVSRNWALDDTYCSSFVKPYAYWFTVATHMATDASIFGMPFFLFRRLSLPLHKKIGISVMFAVGFLNIFVAITRVVIVGTAFRMSTVVALSSVEMATAIMIACSPPLKWFWQKHVGGFRARRRSHQVMDDDDIVEWGTLRLAGRPAPAEPSATSGDTSVKRHSALGPVGSAEKSEVSNDYYVAGNEATERGDGLQLPRYEGTHGRPIRPTAELDMVLKAEDARENSRADTMNMHDEQYNSISKH